MTARQLLWLYPRAWRERYAEEFVALLGDRQLGFGEWIDIVSGAIDARTSPEVRRASAKAAAAKGGLETMSVIQALKRRECGQSTATIGESLVGAAVIIFGTMACVAAGLWLQSEGSPGWGRLLAESGWLFLFVLVGNALFLKGQSWRARAFFVGGQYAALLLLLWPR